MLRFARRHLRLLSVLRNEGEAKLMKMEDFPFEDEMNWKLLEDDDIVSLEEDKDAYYAELPEKIEGGWDFFSSRIFEIEPEEGSQFMPERLTTTMVVDNMCIMNNARLEKIEIETDEGTKGILPGHYTECFMVNPGSVIKMYRGEDKVDFYFTAGGFVFVFDYGPLFLNVIDAYHMEEFDEVVLRRELKKQRRLLKSKNEVQLLHAELAIETYEALEEALQEWEQYAED